MKDFFQALSFLTILPVSRFSLPEEKGLARSMAYFPLAGLLLGLLLAMAYFLLSFLFSKSLVLWLTLGWLALLTRGLHLDGFADTVDGFAAGGSKEKILEVMRDSRIGAFGVVGLILLIGAKYLVLDEIARESIPRALILMTVMGRNSMVWVCYRSPYARPGGGLAQPFAENLTMREMVISSLCAFGIGLLLWGLKGALIFLGMVLVSLVFRFFFIRRLNGITGDTLGAANELSELLCLILLTILRN
ncbi:MAG TPA: adenosylcobinamide-GDP ribazoletransferase [Thermodesulfobacteriota bacterium]|nr:adenosylcobinamide-GDP ribazoletransferase [Thermodesulfobacteriota bacterium]